MESRRQQRYKWAEQRVTDSWASFSVGSRSRSESSSLKLADLPDETIKIMLEGQSTHSRHKS
jgi:hypothetical protein